MTETDLTTRQVATLANNQSMRAMAHVGALEDRYNDIVTDNQTLRDEIIGLRDMIEMLVAALDEVDQRSRLNIG